MNQQTYLKWPMGQPRTQMDQATAQGMMPMQGQGMGMGGFGGSGMLPAGNPRDDARSAVVQAMMQRGMPQDLGQGVQALGMAAADKYRRMNQFPQAPGDGLGAALFQPTTKALY